MIEKEAPGRFEALLVEVAAEAVLSSRLLRLPGVFSSTLSGACSD